MSSANFPCPHCGAILRPPQPIPAGRNVRCPSCQVIFVAGKKAEPVVERRPRPTRPRDDEAPRRRPVRRRDEDYDDWEEPAGRRRDENTGQTALIWGLIIGGVAVFLLAIGGIAAAVYFGLGKKPDKQPWAAAPAPVEAQAPAQPVEVNNPPARPAEVNNPLPAPIVGNAEGAIPPGTLQALKAATVFIKVQAGGTAASGSGFLIRTEGKVGYIVTNHHVIDVQPTELNPFPMMGRLPGFPRFRPPIPHLRMPSPFQQPPIKPTVTAVVDSGTPQQRSMNAQVMASDEEADLAVLRVVSTDELPAPLGLKQRPELVETLPVYVFGFPFGKALAVGHTEPAVTVGKASVSSLRRDDHGELARVQISGEINPGNSGGPIVDAQGRLVGVAVAKVVDSNIGFAIPSEQVLRMLDGRLSATVIARARVMGSLVRLQGNVCALDRQSRIKSSRSVQLTVTLHGPRRGAGKPETGVVALARVVDPLGKIQSISVHYAPGDVVGDQRQLGASGKWQPIPTATTVPLKLNEQTADALLDLNLHGPSGGLYTFQYSYVVQGGQPVFTQPRAVQINALMLPAPNIGPADLGMPPIGPGHPRATPAGPPWAVQHEQKPLDADERAEVLKDLSSTNFFKRQAALDRLAQVPPRPKDPGPVARALEPLLKDENSFIRTGAIKALAIWGTPETVPLLLDVLQISDFFTKQAALEALGQMKDKRAVAPIAALLSDFGSRAAATNALKAMGPSAEKEVAKYLRSTDIWLKKTACEILKDIGTRQSLPALEKIVRDPSIHIRVHVAPTAREAVAAIRARAKKH